MQLHATIVALSLTLLATGVVTFFTFNKWRTLSAFFFALYFLGFVIWTGGILANLLTYSTNPAVDTFRLGSLPYLTEQVLFFGAVLFITGKFWFVKTYPENRMPKSVWEYWPLLLTIAAAIATIIPGSLFTYINITPQGYTLLDMGPATLLFTIFLFVHYFYIIGIIARKIRTAKHSVTKRRFRVFFWAHAITLLFVISLNWVLPIFFGQHHFNALGPITTFISVGAFAYAVTHHRFLDLRIQFQRLLTHLASVTVLLALLWYVFSNAAELTRINILLIDVATVLTALVVFMPIKIFFNRIFNILIFGTSQNYQERLHDAITQIASSNLTVKDAAAAMLLMLKKTLNLRDCRFVPVGEMPAIRTDDHTSLFANGDSLYAEELASRGEMEMDQRARKISEMLEKNKIAVIQPIIHDDKLIGAITAGEKTDDKLFTSNELDEIKEVAERAKLYFASLGEEKEIDQLRTLRDKWGKLENLEDRINNPLSHIVLSAEKLGREHRKISPELREMSTNAFQSSRAFRHFLEIENLSKQIDFIQEPAELDIVLQDAFSQTHSQLLRRGFTKTPKINLKGTANLAVIGNPTILSTVITELLINAFLFGKQPITLTRKDEGDVVSVQVTNIGYLKIAEINKALTLFGRFGKNAGNGLGLNYVKKFVEEVGGYLTLSSRNKKVVVEIVLQKTKL